MSVRPIDFNGMMQNTQEVSNVRANEEHRPMVQQEAAVQTMETQVEQSTHEVHEQANAGEESALDAEGGSGTGYRGNRGRKQKKKKKQRVADGVVRAKGSHQSFDITV